MCERNFAKDPPYGSGRWKWFYVAKTQRLEEVIPAATNVDVSSWVCPPRRAERVDGEGIKNAVEMQDDRLSDRRHARTVLRHSDASDLCLSQVMIRPASAPPRAERMAGEGIPHTVETQHDRHSRKTCMDCSPSLRRLGPLPSPRCCGQSPNSPRLPSPKMPIVGKTRKMMMDNTIKLRKGTPWLLRLDMRKNYVRIQNTVVCGELTAMVID